MSTHSDWKRDYYQTYRATIEPFREEVRLGGMMTLRLCLADGRRIAVRAGEEWLLRQLVAEFGSLIAAEGQQIDFTPSPLQVHRIRAVRDLEKHDTETTGAQNGGPEDTPNGRSAS